jgi:hypothetical protein
LNAEFKENFAAPFVKESGIKIGLKFVEEIPIKLNGTVLMIGEIQHLFFPENAWLENGNVDLSSVEDVCVSSLGTYYEVKQIAEFPYAKPGELPDFER